MFTILEHLKNRYMSQKAQGIVEYALILAFVVVVAAALLKGGDLSTAVKNIFDNTASQLSNASSGTK